MQYSRGYKPPFSPRAASIPVRGPGGRKGTSSRKPEGPEITSPGDKSRKTLTNHPVSTPNQPKPLRSPIDQNSTLECSHKCCQWIRNRFPCPYTMNTNRRWAPQRQTGVRNGHFGNQRPCTPALTKAQCEKRMGSVRELAEERTPATHDIKVAEPLSWNTCSGQTELERYDAKATKYTEYWCCPRVPRKTPDK